MTAYPPVSTMNPATTEPSAIDSHSASRTTVPELNARTDNARASVSVVSTWSGAARYPIASTARCTTTARATCAATNQSGGASKRSSEGNATPSTMAADDDRPITAPARIWTWRSMRAD